MVPSLTFHNGLGVDIMTQADTALLKELLSNLEKRIDSQFDRVWKELNSLRKDITTIQITDAATMATKDEIKQLSACVEVLKSDKAQLLGGWKLVMFVIGNVSALGALAALLMGWLHG